MIAFSVGNFPAQVRALGNDVRRMGDALTDYKEPLTEAVNKVILPSIAKNFMVGGRPPWLPLAAETVAHPKRGRGPTLVDTGNLRSVAVSERPWRITSKEADMSVGMEELAHYGKFHQTGTRNMPARVFALIQSQDERDIEEIFMRWAMRVATTKGGWPPL